MKNIFKDMLVDVFEDTKHVSLWKMVLAAVIGILWCAASIAALLVTVLQKSGHPVDWAFVAIITGGAVALVLLVGVYVAGKTYHWIDKK